MYQSDQLQKMIDWDNIMKMNRNAGGHDEQMIGLFKDSTLIAHWNQNEYSGMVATCVQLSDKNYALYNDYYGSCSGCDSWEDATDESVRNMCIQLSNNSLIFSNINEVVQYLNSEEKDKYSWNKETSDGLLENIIKNVEISREIKITDILNKE